MTTAFNELHPVQQRILRQLAEVFLFNARQTAEKEFAAENDRRVAGGRKPMMDNRLSTLNVYPPRHCDDAGPVSEGEVFTGPAGQRYIIEPGQPCSYMSTWAQWKAGRAMMQTLEQLGSTTHDGLCFLGFYFTYGVLAFLTDGERVPIGIRSGTANHEGRLSIPGGFVMAGQTLRFALADQLLDEVLIDWRVSRAELAATFDGPITFGGHDKAPSATFVAKKQMPPFGDVDFLPANNEWAAGRLPLVPINEVKSALFENDLGPIQARFKVLDLTVTGGFATDVISPLKAHFV